MKYLLVIGFHCEVYRREPRARIFVDDKLIDEFYISHYTDPIYVNKAVDLKHQLDPYNKRKYLEKSIPLRFYHLDIEDRLQQTHICIEIDNNDSNYNNGFINKSTLLQFRILSLLPADRKIYEWFRQKAQNQRFTYRYAWYHRKCTNNFFTLQNKATWIGINQQKVFDYDDAFNCDIGGSGSLHCELIKKYGILLKKLPDPKQTYIYGVSNDLHSLIYDKYEQHANQRNTD